MGGWEDGGVAPYGGALEVARLDRWLHVQRKWSSRCRACRERFPCETRQRADAALSCEPATASGTTGLKPVSLLATIGTLLVVAAGALMWRGLS